jgi:membrane-associated phospholipid phosphatase
MKTDWAILRIRSNWRRKIVLSFVLSVGIWTAYLVLQRHPVFHVTVMKAARLDQLVPFVPNAVYLYESIWLLMPVAPWLMKSREELNRYTKGLVLVALVGFSIFFFHPSLAPRPKEPPDLNALYGLLIRLDSELNAFPSLHCAFAVFHGACCYAVFSEVPWHRGIRWIVWVWVAGILLSTLLTKQHVLADAAAGSVLGIAGYALCCRAKERQI